MPAPVNPTGSRIAPRRRAARAQVYALGHHNLRIDMVKRQVTSSNPCQLPHHVFHDSHPVTSASRCSVTCSCRFVLLYMAVWYTVLPIKNKAVYMTTTIPGSNMSGKSGCHAVCSCRMTSTFAPYHRPPNPDRSRIPGNTSLPEIRETGPTSRPIFFPHSAIVGRKGTYAVIEFNISVFRAESVICQHSQAWPAQETRTVMRVSRLRAIQRVPMNATGFNPGQVNVACRMKRRHTCFSVPRL